MTCSLALPSELKNNFMLNQILSHNSSTLNIVTKLRKKHLMNGYEVKNKKQVKCEGTLSTQ